MQLYQLHAAHHNVEGCLRLRLSCLCCGAATALLFVLRHQAEGVGIKRAGLAKYHGQDFAACHHASGRGAYRRRNGLHALALCRP
jgi:hypothetical protein